MELVIERGRTYRAKKPSRAGGVFVPLVNDRTVISTNGNVVQYDSPSVARGRHYPTVTIEKFRRWAARDVTDELPKGEYAEWPSEGRTK